MLHQEHEATTAIIAANYHWKNWVDWICAMRDKMTRPQKRAWKLKNIAFLHFMTTFHDSTLKIETGWAKNVVKPISEPRNIKDKC